VPSPPLPPPPVPPTDAPRNGGWSPTSSGHLITGLTTLHSEGIAKDGVFLPCDTLDRLPPDTLNRLNQSAFPSLNACGRHNLGDH
jgi:hypothetical protein